MYYHGRSSLGYAVFKEGVVDSSYIEIKDGVQIESMHCSKKEFIKVILL